jgi:hypothetical protein
LEEGDDTHDDFYRVANVAFKRPVWVSPRDRDISFVALQTN